MFYMEVLEFPHLCSEPTKICRDGKQGVLEIGRFTPQGYLLQIYLLTRAVGLQYELEMESLFL